MFNLRKDGFPHILLGTKKRTVHIRTVRFVLQVGENRRSGEENSPEIDFLLRGQFARESWRTGAADTGRDKAEEGGIPAAVFRPTTTQDMPASVRLRGCASRAS